MARLNEYDSDGRIVLRDTEGTVISFYRFMQFVLGPNSHPWAPPWWWGGYSGHQGYDLGAPAYSEVRSTCTGKVVVVYGVNDGDRSMGNAVCVEETGQGLGAVVRTHRYMHFAQYPSVAVGDIVEQGTLLGYVGTTGQSSGNHLHYDVTKNGPWGEKLDAWDQFNHSSEPSGWTPQRITDASGSPWGTSLSWDVIGETTGINYGPGKAGGGPEYTPKTYMTNKPVLSVGWRSVANRSYIKTDEIGGLLIQVGSLSTDDTKIQHLSEFKQWYSRYQGKTPLGFYLYSYISPRLTMTELKRRLQKFLDALIVEGITPEDADLGVWLYLGDDSPTATYTANINIVKAFRELMAGKNYPTTGVGCSTQFITDHLRLTDLEGIPLWLTAWTTTDGTSYASSKNDITSYVPSTIYDAVQDSLYIWNDGKVSYPKGLIDHNWVMLPIPGLGYNETPVGPTPIGIPEILPAAEIFFEPTPGRILNSSVELTVVTNANNAVIGYTIDNSIPTFPDPATQTAYLAQYKRLPSEYPGQNLFIRAYAFDRDTQEVVAKGAACYAWVWSRPTAYTEQPVAIDDVEVPYLEE